MNKMPTCKCCGKRGLFLKLQHSLCEDCQYKLAREQKNRQAEQEDGQLDKIDFAEQIMNSLLLGGMIDQKYKRAVEKVHEQFGRQGTIAAYAAELCGSPTTPKGYYIKSRACEWAGAKYRPETIKWTKKWIESGLDYLGMPGDKYIHCSVYQSREYDAYSRLGEAEEKEYLYEDALISYQKAFEARPEAYNLIVRRSTVLTKLGRIDDAIKLVKNEKPIDPLFKNVQRETLKELKDKKARGYVYRPRKKKSVE